jgi:hypothetical protein
MNAVYVRFPVHGQRAARRKDRPRLLVEYVPPGRALAEVAALFGTVLAVAWRGTATRVWVQGRPGHGDIKLGRSFGVTGAQDELHLEGAGESSWACERNNWSTRKGA